MTTSPRRPFAAVLLDALAGLAEASRDHPDARALFEADAASGRAALELGPADAAIAAIATALGLGRVERAAAVLALAVESDPRWSALLALLQGRGESAGPTRPTPGLLAQLGASGALSAAGATTRSTLHELLNGVALGSGLLRWADATAAPPPAHSRALAFNPALLALLVDGAPGAHAAVAQRPLAWPGLTLSPVQAVAWPLPQTWRSAVDALAAMLHGRQAAPPTIVLRGAAPTELRAVAAALAAAAGRRVFEWRGTDAGADPSAVPAAGPAGEAGLVPILLALHAWPLWMATDAAPGSTLTSPSLAPSGGLPLLIAAAAEITLTVDGEVIEIDLAEPTPADRFALWSAVRRNPLAATEVDRLAVTQSCCALSVLAQAATQAAAVPADQAPPAAAAIERAVRSAARSLTAWARLSTDHVAESDWVGPQRLQEEIGLLLTRCRARADLGRPLGPLLAHRLDIGVKALFIGASGTGKTLAAQWLADRLARPLVKVDLATVVSKYIGETEKNLAHLLGRAESLDAVLLFDEADSLFGTRTDVRQANDRYANMQTNYLLQRIETFRGVALLTSNSKARFDDAFMRRLDAVVEFPLPDAAERRQLWALHLGQNHAVNAGLLARVAALADLPGGHIRNAVLAAALFARRRVAGSGDDEVGVINDKDLRQALALEYRKLGQRLPESLA
jgi:hypothetical protein